MPQATTSTKFTQSTTSTTTSTSSSPSSASKKILPVPSHLLLTCHHKLLPMWILFFTLVLLFTPLNAKKVNHGYYDSSITLHPWNKRLHHHHQSSQQQSQQSQQQQQQQQQQPAQQASDTSVNQQVHRWIDPCRAKPLPIMLQSDQASKFDPQVDEREILDTIIAASHMARHSGEKTKKKFIKEVMKSDASIEVKLERWRQEWLPKVPAVSEDFLQSYSSPEQAIAYVFQLLQYFAVGMQQVMLDIVIDDGKMWQDVKKIENQLYQLTCEVRLAMYLRKVQPDPHVKKDVMGQEFKDINKKSTRNIRDYLILRDYVSAVNFTHELFIYLRTQLIPTNRVLR